MKKYSAFFSLLLLLCLTYSTPAFNQNNSYRFVVKVISADKRQPIEGATVSFAATSTSHSERRVESADWDGMAYRDFDFYGTFTINAEAPGFYGSSFVVVKKWKDASGDVPVTLVLKRKAGVKLVTVSVFEKGTGKLIYDAQVNLKGYIYSYNGTTNASGEAVIPVDHGDDYAVTVTHNGYKAVEGNVRVKEYDDTQSGYGLSFEMEPTNNFKRVMLVKVQERDLEGKVWSVGAASVTFTYEGTTFEHKADLGGITEFAHNIAPGESVRIDVAMGGYKSQTKTIIIKAKGAETTGPLSFVIGDQEKDIAVFTLVRAKGLERTLSVKVIDNKGDPVKFADVNFPDDGLKITNAYGNCTYTIKWPTDEPLIVSAEKKGYASGSAQAKLNDDNVEILLIKKGDERNLHINVKDEKGEPVPYANVSFPDGNSVNTDMSGHCDYKITSPADQSVKIEVSKKGFKSKSAEADPKSDNVFVKLEKSSANRTLHISVTDNKGQAIKYAGVNFPDGNIKATDAYGKCEYTINWPVDEELKIEVEKTGYKSKSVNASPGNNSIALTLEKDDGVKPCEGSDAEAFSKLTGSWKSYRMHVTVGGSCSEATGTWKVTEWCEGVDETYNATVARINGTFKGKMSGGALQVEYESPPSPNNSKGTKGQGYIYIQTNGTLYCSGFGCIGELKKQ